MNKYSRRAFVTASLSGAGAITFSSPFQLVKAINDSRKVVSQSKKLLATTDFADNIVINNNGSRYGTPVNRTDDYYAQYKCFMDKRQLDDLHKFLASLGVKRHQWIVDTMWSLYDHYPHGFNLLKEAADSAHKYGMEFYAVIKPFEGGGFGTILPDTMPCPDDTKIFRDIRGIYPRVRPFPAANPALNLKRKAGTYNGTGSISAIRLIKYDDNPTRVKAQHLSIWTSAHTNGFAKYKGPVTYRETVEERYRFPYWRRCRVLHLGDLSIPGDHKYLLIRCSLADEKGDFCHEKGSILELVGSDGNVLPHTLSSGRVLLDEHYTGFYQSKIMRQMVRYLQHPEVLSMIDDKPKLEEHYRDYYAFSDYNPVDRVTLDKEGYIAAACGKPEYIMGILNPVYPEVRKHWLDFIRFCLDRGVDGINLRLSNHTLASESWEYGFNEPVLKASNGKTDYATISKINGDAYTSFLREARELIKRYGKSLAVHLETELIIPDDRPGKRSSFFYNCEWQWETWVREIADEFEVRGIYQLRPWNFSKALDVFSAATLAANKPLYLQGDFHGMTFDGSFESARNELELVNNHPGLNGYVYYETANITRVNDNDELEGSPGIVEVLNKTTLK